MRLLISLLLFLQLCTDIVSQDHILPVIPVIDTLHAYVDNKNNTYFEYYSESGHISSELARHFRVRASEMLSLGEATSLDASSEGRSVLIPFDPEALLKSKCTAFDCIPVIYTVRPKETVFKIARRYFDLKIDQLRSLNSLESNDISIDQQLVVGWFVMHPVTESVHGAADNSISEIKPIDPFYPEVPSLQIGVAYWKKSQKDATQAGDAHLFAMHRSARINSMIEITNPMFKRKVLVKVVGRIPPTYNQDITLVVSPAVAKKLGVLDPRFRAEMRFVE